MNKKEITEIKKLFKKDDNGITRICGCYVDAEKNKRLELREAFYSLPEEEMFKYVEIFRKTLRHFGKKSDEYGIPIGGGNQRGGETEVFDGTFKERAAEQ